MGFRLHVASSSTAPFLIQISSPGFNPIAMLKLPCKVCGMRKWFPHIVSGFRVCGRQGADFNDNFIGHG